MTTWSKISAILTPPHNPSVTTPTPHPGDTTQLLPARYLPALQARSARAAAAAKLAASPSAMDPATLSLQATPFAELMATLQTLLRHFDRLVSAEADVTRDLHGHAMGEAIWVSPDVREDLVQFVRMIEDGVNKGRDGRVDELLLWALRWEPRRELLDAGVDSGAEAFTTLHEAFLAFEKARDDMAAIYVVEMQAEDEAVKASLHDGTAI